MSNSWESCYGQGWYQATDSSLTKLTSTTQCTSTQTAICTGWSSSSSLTFNSANNGLPKLRPGQLTRKTWYPDNFLINFSEKPKSFYDNYDFLQEDPYLKLFDLDGVLESAAAEEVFSNYRKSTNWHIEQDVDASSVVNKWELDVHYKQYQNSSENELLSTI